MTKAMKNEEEVEEVVMEIATKIEVRTEGEHEDE